jgi:outer membrane protein TolC
MLLGSLVLGIPGTAPALDPPPAARDPDQVVAEELATFAGESLSLDEALRLSLEGSTELRSAEAALRVARGALRREKGSYDPVLFAEILRSEEDTPTASPFAGAEVLETDVRSVNAGARLRLPIGTELAAVVQTTRLETNSAFAALNPEHATNGRLELRQPLLRGFGPAANVEVSAAARDLDAARARASDTALSVAANTESAYWTLHAAERELAVRRILARSGENLVEQATRRVEVGLAGPGELATARLFLADQELAVLEAEESLDAASDALASLIGRRPSDARFRTATPPPGRFEAPDEATALARSLDRNAELRAAEANLAAAEARSRAAFWDRFPRLDILGSLGGNGLAGTGRTVAFLDTTITTDASGGFSESFEQVTSRDFPTWSIGLSL